MRISPKQYARVAPVDNIPAAGPAVMPLGVRIDEVRGLTILQTTPNIAITLPTPTDQSIIYSIDVHNIGSEAFGMYGVTVTPAAFARFGWNGTAWVPDVAPTAQGSVVETLVPTAQNTLPNLGNVPLAGASIKFFVNGVYAPAGITVTGVAVTVASGTLGFNIETYDSVVAEYYVL